MPKIETKIRKPASAATKNTNGKAATKKVPLYKTLPPETDPEMLHAYQLLVEAAADVRENLARNFEPEPGKES